MSVYSIYFSPTGGTKKAVQALAQSWDVTAQPLDLTVPPTEEDSPFPICFDQQDVCFIGVPSFGGRVPTVAVERISKLKAKGALAILVVAYGNRHYDDTLLELKERVVACGFRLGAAVAAVTEHSILHQYATGRPDAQDVETLAAFAHQIKTASEQGRLSADLALPGNHPFKEYNGVPLKPKTAESCTKCGLCAQTCPVGAIPATQPNETNPERCISCMRCIQACPTSARRLDASIVAMLGEKLKAACEDKKENTLFY